MRNKKLNQTSKVKIFQAYKNGGDVAVIAKEFKISVGYVRQVIQAQRMAGEEYERHHRAKVERLNNKTVTLYANRKLYFNGAYLERPQVLELFKSGKVDKIVKKDCGTDITAKVLIGAICQSYENDSEFLKYVLKFKEQK